MIRKYKLYGIKYLSLRFIFKREQSKWCCLQLSNEASGSWRYDWYEYPFNEHRRFQLYAAS